MYLDHVLPDFVVVTLDPTFFRIFSFSLANGEKKERRRWFPKICRNRPEKVRVRATRANDRDRMKMPDEISRLRRGYAPESRYFPSWMDVHVYTSNVRFIREFLSASRFQDRPRHFDYGEIESRFYEGDTGTRTETRSSNDRQTPTF